MHEPCALLDWDSAFWGFPIARVCAGRLDAASLRQIDCWSRARAIRCLYLLASANDVATATLAEAAGFRLVDRRVTYARSRGAADPPAVAAPNVRRAVEADIPALRRLARTSYHDSRFYADPNFPRELCDELYATWIEKSCAGFAQAVFVAESNGQLAGYVSCHGRPGAAEGSIGLLSVAPAARGAGIGQQLVQHACAWFGGRAVSQVKVVTQGRNRAAQRLYQRAGFGLVDERVWFHRWADGAGAASAATADFGRPNDD